MSGGGSTSARTEPQDRLGGAIDGVLHLLDRQLLDRDDKLIGKVDDVELTDGPHGLEISGVLTGAAALLPRLGGRLGSRLLRLWGELEPTEPGRTRPWRIDQADLDRLDSALHLAVPRDGVLRKDREEHRLGELSGMVVLDGERNAVGHVLDARFSPDNRRRLVLRSLIVGRGRPGSFLGYDRRGNQGPWLVRTVVRRLHRHTVLADATGAEIDWAHREVVLAAVPTETPDHALE